MYAQSRSMPGGAAHSITCHQDKKSRRYRYYVSAALITEAGKHLERMLEGIKAGQDPNLLIRDVVLSDEDTRAKMAPFTNVAGAEGVFHLCMLTVLATLATGRPQG
jgi:hypothetical protein